MFYTVCATPGNFGRLRAINSPNCTLNWLEARNDFTFQNLKTISLFIPKVARQEPCKIAVEKMVMAFSGKVGRELRPADLFPGMFHISSECLNDSIRIGFTLR